MGESEATQQGGGSVNAGLQSLLGELERKAEAIAISSDRKGLNSTDARIVQLKRRLLREASLAISMLEYALDALWRLDLDKAMSIRLTDDRIDQEEVAIESECYEVLALHHPYARDFRLITFVLRVNGDLERVGDHASSICKVTRRIHAATGGVTPVWPTALKELGERVPAMCHELMQAVLDEDVETARKLVASDRVIDELEKRLFEEAQEMIRKSPNDDSALAVGMLIYRLGRELERVGDIMASVAEDVVYLATGDIIRHEKRLKQR